MKSTGVNPQYFTFSGSPIDGDISINISGGTTTLLGNPYAGTLDANAFILNNENTISGTLYFWEQSGESKDLGHLEKGYEGGYAQYNLGMGTAANTALEGTSGLTDGYTYTAPTRYIAVGQGFFVASDTDGGTIRFYNKQRSYQATEPHFFKGTQKKVDNATLPILKLGMNYTNENNLTIHRQIGISFKENHSYKSDYGYDSQMIDVQPTDMFWSFREMDDKKLVIAGIESVNDNLEIPLTIQVDSEEPVFIQIDELKNINNTIYLYDALEDVTKELKADDFLELVLPKGTYSDRFFITFKNNKSLNVIDEATLTTDLNIYLDEKSNQISIVNNSNLLIENVDVFNLLGQKVKTWKLNVVDTNIVLDANSLSTKIYIVKVKTNKGVTTVKVLKN